jgi:hypothetical protein
MVKKEMVKCPICGYEIKEVLKGYVKYAYDKLYIDEKGNFRKFIDEDGTDWAFEGYYCPECYSEIIELDSDEDVEKFLRGEKKIEPLGDLKQILSEENKNE